MVTQKILMRGTCRDASSVATVLTKVNGVSNVQQAIECDPEGCEPEERITEDATALYSLTVEVPDELLAERVREVASIAAELLDADIRFPNRAELSGVIQGSTASIKQSFLLAG